MECKKTMLYFKSIKCSYIGVIIFLIIPFKLSTAIVKSDNPAVNIVEKPHCTDETILLTADSICQTLNIPFEIVYELGKNESRWHCIEGKYQDYGDLQVIPITFNYWYKKLNLSGGKTRYNYLLVGINYLKYQYDKYNNWEKARYAYGRGSWKPKYNLDSLNNVQQNWTNLECKFMASFNWNKYN